MVKAGGNAMYRRAADILLEAKYTFGGTSLNQYGDEELREMDIAKSELGAIHKYQSAQLLVIDEVDRTSKKDWSASTIFTILDHRYNERDKLCTIVITNVHPDKLDPAFGYLASRMRDGYRVAVTGKELRG
jgi:DNA replication protein DnaC